MTKKENKPSSYVCPLTKNALYSRSEGLESSNKKIFPFLYTEEEANPIPNFLEENNIGELTALSLAMYKDDTHIQAYKNFLNWLFSTFNENEINFREKIHSKMYLKKGDVILITGCGLGEDILNILKCIGKEGKIYAQDLSSSMIHHANKFLHDHLSAEELKRVFLSVGNASTLPFSDDFFNAAFHFGGINLFDDKEKAISEMNRVVLPGGRVVFGDEGVAPWLKESEIGKIVINNNPLWSSEPPLNFLPEKCTNVNLNWVLGNCFYIIDFIVSNRELDINIDVPHKGKRGGTMRTRYFGQLEGVSPATKKKAIDAAFDAKISVHEWLEKIIKKELDKIT